MIEWLGAYLVASQGQPTASLFVRHVFFHLLLFQPHSHTPLVCASFFPQCSIPSSLPFYPFSSDLPVFHRQQTLKSVSSASPSHGTYGKVTITSMAWGWEVDIMVAMGKVHACIPQPDTIRNFSLGFISPSESVKQGWYGHNWLVICVHIA